MFGAKTIEQFVRDDRNIKLGEHGEREAYRRIWSYILMTKSKEINRNWLGQFREIRPEMYIEGLLW